MRVTGTLPVRGQSAMLLPLAVHKDEETDFSDGAAYETSGCASLKDSPRVATTS